MLLLFMEMSRKREKRIIVWSVLRNLHPQRLQNLREDKVTSAIDLQRCGVIFRSPLEVNNVERGSLIARPVHAPKPGIAPEDLEAGAEAEDHVRLLRRLARPVPVDGPGDGAALTEVDDGILEAVAADVAPPHGSVPVP